MPAWRLRLLKFEIIYLTIPEIGPKIKFRDVIMSCIQNNQQNVIFHVLELFFIIQPEPRRKQMGRDDRLLIIKINHVTRPGNTWMQIGIDPEGIFKNLREYAFYLIITPMRSTQNWKDLAEYKSENDASYSKNIQFR